MTSTLQSYQNPEKQGKTRKASQPRGDYGDMATTYNAVSWRKRTLMKKTGKIQIVYSLANSDVLMLIS